MEFRTTSRGASIDRNKPWLPTNPSKSACRRWRRGLYCPAMTDLRTRLHRSELAVPGSNVRMLEKAPELGADIVMPDLEDAVAPDDKEQARVNIIEALLEQDWSRCSVSLRINGLDTHFCYRDIVDVVEQAGQHLDAIMIPKAGCAGDVHLVSTLLTQIEDAVGLRRRLGISVLIETAMGMVNCEEIARA